MITANERFSAQTKLKEVMQLDIKEIARCRWDEYEKCWNATDFLWWEHENKIHDEFMDSISWIAFPMPKENLAKNLILYVKIREKLYTVIRDLCLEEKYSLYCNDFDNYKPLSTRNIEIKKSQKEIEKKLYELNPRRHLKIVK